MSATRDNFNKKVKMLINARKMKELEEFLQCNEIISDEMLLPREELQLALDETDSDQCAFKKPANVSRTVKSATCTSNSSTSSFSKKAKGTLDTATSSSKSTDSVLSLISYEVPFWADVPQFVYNLEVMKNGVILDCIDLTVKAAHFFGRSPHCDFILNHPTISRFHAILLYKGKKTDDEMQCGYYLYDTGSSHGTFLNKRQIQSKAYHRVKVGYMIKFGLSTRTYILNGPDNDQDAESVESVTEIKLKKAEELRQNEKIEHSIEETGIDWGMGEDADSSKDLSDNPFAASNNEDFYKNEPKKVLGHFMEREGLPLNFDCNEQTPGHYLCRIELPIDDMDGKPIIVEVTAKGKKKDIIEQCAMEACRILDMNGVLRQSSQESKKVQAKDWAKDDYYDSDDDLYLDRTGLIEKKRYKRMKSVQGAETFESLKEKQNQVGVEIDDIQKRLEQFSEQVYDDQNSNNPNVDSLDNFMNQISSISKVDRITKRQLKQRLSDLEKTSLQLSKLIKAAEPVQIEPIIIEKTNLTVSESVLGNATATATATATVTSTASENRKKSLPLYGKRFNLKMTEKLRLEKQLQPQLQAKPIEGVENNDTNNNDEEPKIDEKSLSSTYAASNGCDNVITAKNVQTQKVNNASVAFDSTKDGYDIWVPPSNQTGDGKISLNDKLGY